MSRILLILFLLVGFGAAQDAPLGDIARKMREQREAAELANFKPGNPPPLLQEGEVLRAHFLTISGDAGQGEFDVKLNGQTVFHNSYIRDLPIYVTTLLLDGGNELDVSFTSGKEPLNFTVEERYPGDMQHHVLATFRADASETPVVVKKQVHFAAHPRALPPLQLDDQDRAAIRQAVQTFYEALRRKDAKQVLSLFAPAIEDARPIYPEGADFGQVQLKKMSEMVMAQGFEMEIYDSAGLEFIPKGATVVVQHADGKPVFSSSQVKLPNGSMSSIDAETIPLKKIKGSWQLTLPFGF